MEHKLSVECVASTFTFWSETLTHSFYAKIHVSLYAAGGQLTPNP